MKKLKKNFVMVLLLVAVILISGCASTVLVDKWYDASFNEPTLKKVFVIGLRKDYVQRRIWEDAFVIELVKEGIFASASYHLFPETLPDTNQVIQVILDKGYDGILVTRLLYSETRTQYVPGYETEEQVMRYNNFRRRYESYYHTVHHPGYEESSVINRKAIDVWAIRDEERLIWSATSNTPERITVEEVQDDVASLVVEELANCDIIKPKK